MSPPMNGTFDGSQFNPEQGGTKHPVGNKFPATVINASCEGVKENPNAGMYVVEFGTQAGKIIKRYNLWSQSSQAVEIAQKHLSALCYATGIFKLNWQNEGREMIGGRCCIDVQFQAGNEPTTEKPQGGYVEVSKVYDANGNEPGKTPQQQQPAMQQPNQQPAQQPLQQQPGGGWGNQPNQQPQPQQNAGWGGPQPQQQPNPAPGPSSGGWQQQPQGNPGGPAMTPPWGQR